MKKAMLHETVGYDQNDKFFVLGRNPDGRGGGIIGSTNDKYHADKLRDRALMEDYTEVRVRTWREMNYTEVTHD